MGFSASSSAQSIALSAVLMAAPTGATPIGYYIQIFGVPPTGISLNDIFRWDGGVANLVRSYTLAPPSVSVNNGSTYLKLGGTWCADSLQVSGVLTTPPTAGNVAGLYAQTAGTVTGYALGDIFYWSGSAVTKYLSYVDAPSTITLPNNSTYAKNPSGIWLALAPATGVMSYNEPLTLTGFTTNPVKGATRLRDYINAVDDGSGWVAVDFAYCQQSVGTAGSGGLIIKLPAALTFDTKLHPLNPAASTSNGIQYASDEFKFLIPCAGFQVNANVSSDMIFGVIPVLANTFCIAFAGTKDYSLGTISSATSLSSTNFHIVGSFRFKKA